MPCGRPRATDGESASEFSYSLWVLVKGTAFVARRAYLVGAFGREAFDAFFDPWRAAEPDFALEILPISTIPVQAFLRFADAVVDHFFDGDAESHWTLGRASAEWALREGPYKAFFRTQNYVDFLRTAPTLWKAYYSEGRFEASFDEATRTVDARIELPVQHKHLHFERNVMGYLRGALELIGATVETTVAVESYERGDDRVHYRFVLAPD